MNDWENTCVIPCVNSFGEPLTVIEQSRADRTRRALSLKEKENAACRYILGNGALVKRIGEDRFVLPQSNEIISRQ